MTDMYFDYEKMMMEIDGYMSKYNFISVTGMANSILGRTIPVLMLGEGKGVITYVGGEVGRDKISSRVLLRFVRDICSLYEERGTAFGFSAESILKNYTLVIIPMLNPDGSFYCHRGVDDDNPLKERALALNDGKCDFSLWSGNARGIDLRYNYGTEYGEYESEPEIGALCNFLRYGITPDILLVFSESDDENEIIYYGEGEIDNKMAIALSQMSRMKRGYKECDLNRLMLFEWARQELFTHAFSIELANISSEGFKDFSDRAFSCYTEMRKTLFCAPFLNKIK